MPLEEEVVTLASVGDGAALELFDVEFQRLLKNIADPNTSATQKRSISIKIEVAPDESRDVGEVRVHVTSKLATIKPVKQSIYFGRRDGKLLAVQSNPRQSSIFDDPSKRAENAKVVPLSQVPRTQTGD